MATTNEPGDDQSQAQPDVGGVREKLAAAQEAATSAREKNFAEWFGDSKVVDEEGKPKTVHHGSKADFDTFRVDSQLGAHFGTEKQAQNFVDKDSGKVQPFHLSLKNPIRLKDTPGWGAEAIRSQLAEHGIHLPDAKTRGYEPYGQWQNRVAREAIEGAGYDGIVYLNEFEGVDQSGMQKEMGEKWGHEKPSKEMLTKHGAADSYIAFHPQQIKHATANRGTFDPDDPRIHMKHGGTVPAPLPETMGLAVQAHGTASKKHREAVQGFAEALPAGIVEALRNFGVKIQAIGTIGDIIGEEEAKNRRIAVGAGAYNKKNKVISVSEKSVSGEHRHGAAAKTFRHEVGYAIDWSLERLSQSDPYAAAVAADVAAMSDEDKENYAYFISQREGEKTKRGETFAENFAHLTRPDADSPAAKRHEAAFPNTLAWMRSHPAIKSLIAPTDGEREPAKTLPEATQAPPLPVAAHAPPLIPEAAHAPPLTEATHAPSLPIATHAPALPVAAHAPTTKPAPLPDTMAHALPGHDLVDEDTAAQYQRQHPQMPEAMPTPGHAPVQTPGAAPGNQAQPVGAGPVAPPLPERTSRQHTASSRASGGGGGGGELDEAMKELMATVHELTKTVEKETRHVSGGKNGTH